MLFGHPKGLFVLFFTEMWERFSFYGMRGLLVLYMITAAPDGGLGWTKGDALSLYGTYLGAAWLIPLVGGVVADRWLGQRKSIVIGGLLMAVGHFLMAVPEIWAFYSALALLAVGVGFFKPCVTSIVGALYEKGDSRRDGGFSIFYAGINIGALLAGLICGWLATEYSYHVGFVTAGFGMLIGLAVFLWGRKYLGQAGVLVKKEEKKTTNEPLTAAEKRKVWAVVFISLLVVLFTAAFEQAGGLLNVYAHEYIDRFIGAWEIPTAWFQSLNPFFIILCTPAVAFIWASLGKRGRDPSVGAKLGIGFILTAIAFFFMMVSSEGQEHAPIVKANMSWLVLFNFFQTVGELCVYPVVWSAVTKIAPKKYVSTLMAVALAGIGVGSKLAGFAGSFIEKMGPQQIFIGIAIAMAIFGVVSFLVRSKLADREEVKKGAKVAESV